MDCGTTFRFVTEGSVPVLLGSGERIFEGDLEIRLEPVEVGHSPWATHVRYRTHR